MPRCRRSSTANPPARNESAIGLAFVTRPSLGQFRYASSVRGAVSIFSASLSSSSANLCNWTTTSGLVIPRAKWRACSACLRKEPTFGMTLLRGPLQPPHVSCRACATGLPWANASLGRRARNHQRAIIAVRAMCKVSHGNYFISLRLGLTRANRRLNPASWWDKRSGRSNADGCQNTVRCRFFQGAFGWCVPIGALGGLIGLGSGEFRLPVLIYAIGFDAKSADPAQSDGQLRHADVLHDGPKSHPSQWRRLSRMGRRSSPSPSVAA
jgi:hypothetical protein